jgi:hypothetical protein
MGSQSSPGGNPGTGFQGGPGPTVSSV